MDRRPRHRQPGPRSASPAWASICSIATRWSSASRRPTISISARRFFRPRCGPSACMVHLFDGYWEDIGTIKAFYEANLEPGQRQPAVRFSQPLGPDLQPAAIPAADARRRGGRQAQPDRRRLQDRPRLRRSKTASSACRCIIGEGRDDPKHGHHGRRFLRRRRTPRTNTPASRRWASAAAATSKARFSTRTAASAATSASSTSKSSKPAAKTRPASFAKAFPMSSKTAYCRMDFGSETRYAEPVQRYN